MQQLVAAIMSEHEEAEPGVEHVTAVPVVNAADAVSHGDAVAPLRADAPRGPRPRSGSDGRTNAGRATNASGRGGRWFSAFCALVAVAAAGAALTAPWLRPRLDTEARRWLGNENVISHMVAPELSPAETPATASVTRLPPAPSTMPLPLVAVAEAPADRVASQTYRSALTESLAAFDQRLAAYDQRLAAYDQRIQSVAMALETMRGELARAAAARSVVIDELGRRADGLSLRADDLTRRADRLQSFGTTLEARARAGNVLALAIGLRRDVDAGVPIGRDCAALQATGPFPGKVDAALRELARLETGIPSMRDLAEGFEVVQARLTAGTEGWSISRGWYWAWSAFAGAPRSADDAVLEHLRALVAEGRFSEAAGILETSRWAGPAAAWVAMVHARAAGVVATQVILVHALHSTEEAYRANGGDASVVSPH